MRSVSMEDEISIAASTTNKNALSGEQYQVAPFSGYLSVFDTGSATGLRRGLSVGGTSIIDRGVVNTNNRVPLGTDDRVKEGVEVFEGQPIFLPVQNTTVGALTYRYRVVLDEAAEQ